MFLRLAGRVEFFVDSAGENPLSVSVTGDACRITLAVLGLAHPEAVVPSRLADAIWGDDVPVSWQSSLRNAVARLRKQLEPIGDVIEATPNGYRIAVDELRIDVENARATLRRESVQPDERREAFRILQTPFVPGAESDWVDQQADELRSVMLDGLVRFAADLRRGGDGEGALAVALEAVAIDQIRESAHQEALRAYLLLGARAEGLRAYSAWRTTVGEELGAVPAPETEALYLQLLGIDADCQEGSANVSASGQTESTTRGAKFAESGSVHDHRVPVQFSSPLVGRTKETAEILAAIETSRLVTVTGLGGIGKSHLVGEAVRALGLATGLESSTDTTLLWIPLASIDRSLDPMAIVADILGPTATGSGNASDVVLSALATRRAIVVLDGANPRTALPITRLLADSCPDVTTIVTARSALGVPYEFVVRIGPLGSETSSPGEQSASGQLLRREALRLGADPQEWTHLAAEAVAKRLDGVPLALLLAATRAPVMSPQAIANALDERGAKVLDHRDDAGLTSMLDWTIGALSTTARTALHVLGACPEPLDFDAAREICEATAFNSSLNHPATPAAFAEALNELLATGLVHRFASSGHTRFSVLQIVASSLRRLRPTEEQNIVLDAHAHHFAAAADRVALGVRSSEEAQVVRTALIDTANFISAIDHLIRRGAIDRALRLAIDLHGLAFYRLNHSIAATITRAVRAPGATASPQFAEAAASAAAMAWMISDSRSAATFLSWAANYPDSWLFHQAAGVIDLYKGNVTASAEHFEMSVLIAEAHDDAWERAIALSQVTLIRTFQGRDDALDSAIASYRYAEASGNPTALANGAWAIGIALLDVDPEGAREHFLRCQRVANSVGAHLSAGAASTPLALLEHRIGAPFAERCDAVLTQMKFWLDASHSAQFWLVAQEAAVLLVEKKRYRTATLILGALSVAPFKVPLPRTERRNVARITRELADALGPRYATTFTEGTVLSATSTADLIQRELSQTAK